MHRASNARKNQPRSSDSRHTVLRATIELIAAQGLGSATTANIAKAAGVSTGVLQYQFGSKQDIFEAMIVENTSTLTSQLDAFDFSAHDQQSLLNAALDTLWAYYSAPDYRAVMEVLLNHASDSEVFIEVAIQARKVLHDFLYRTYKACGYKLTRKKADQVSEVALTSLRGMSVSNGIFPEHQDDFSAQRQILANSLALFLAGR